MSITACKNDEVEKKRLPFHITYGLPEDLARAGGIVELDDMTIFVVQNSKKSVNIVGVDDFGQRKWSREISCPSENGLVVLTASKIDDERFLLSGNLGTQKPVLIEISKDGTIKKSSKLSVDGAITLMHCTVDSDGSPLYSGSVWLGLSYEGFVAREKSDGNISWARRLPDYPYVAAAAKIGQHTFVIPQFQQGPDRQPILQLDLNGDFVHGTEAFRDGDLMTVAGLSLHDNLYVILTEWNSDSFYLLRLNSLGEVVSSLYFMSAEYPSLTTDGTSLFLTLTKEAALTVFELDADLKTTNKKTIANLVGGNSFAVTGITSVSQQAVSSILLPSDTDPTYGMKGINLIRIFRNNWQTRCQVTEYGAPSIQSSFRTESSEESTIETIEIQKTPVVVDVRDLEISSQSICK